MNVYLEAARPRTLPAAVAPVVVGTVAASTPTPQLDLGRAGLALVVALSLQVAVNYANDYFDGVKGVDTEDRAGPRRAVASGLLGPRAMRRAISLTLAVASLAGLTLAMLVGWELLLVGAVAILATLGYSGGPKPYASAGLGEVMVFVFFGVVATAGSAYVQDGRLTVFPLLTALLVVNNLRDIPTDREVGKATLAVKLGDRQTRILFGMLIAGAYLSLAPIGLYAANLWFLVPLFSLWSARRALAIVRDAVTPAALIPGLAATSQTQLLFAGLLTVALLMNRIAVEGGAV
jgi:1,4-dihydroxy-2-naphthoate polyprenyltransferase